MSNQSTNPHSLSRVVSPPIYAEKTINHNIRRRKARKKTLARDSFPVQAVETVDNEIPIIPPPIESSDEDITIQAISPQIEYPTLLPTINMQSIPPPVDLPPKNTS